MSSMVSYGEKGRGGGFMKGSYFYSVEFFILNVIYGLY